MDDTTLGKVSDLAIESRIKSFECRQIQNKVYIEINALTIKSLKLKLNGYHDKSEELYQQCVAKKEEARRVGYEAMKHQEKASRLDKAYHRALDMLSDDWEKYLDLDTSKLNKEAE